MSDLFPSDHSRNSLLSAQKLAAERAVIRDDFAPIRLIAGADQAFAGDMMLSGIVVLDYPSLEIMERVFSIEQVKFPYTPTFLTFLWWTARASIIPGALASPLMSVWRWMCPLSE